MKILFLLASLCSVSSFAGECPKVSMGSCMVPGDYESCLDLTPSEIPLSAFRANCEASGSTFKAGACPKDGVAKRCEVPLMDYKGIVMSLYGTDEDSEEFSAICKKFSGSVCQ